MGSRFSRWIVAGIFLTVLGVVGLQAARIATFAFSPAQPTSQVKDVIEVRKGQGASDISKLLVSKGVISDAAAFVWLGRLTRQWKKIKAGEYEVSPAMSPIQLFAAITSGVSLAHPVTVREGENMYEIAADLEGKGLASKDQLLALCRDPKFIGSLGLKPPLGPTLEGFLFPDTYHFNRTMTPSDMLKQMVRRFQQEWTPEIQTRAAALGFSQLQAVTLASVVEKETGDPRERPLISSVFHNRLRKRMKLQSDPTTIYGVWERYKGNIHRSHLQAVNDYNTYTLPGLPVGPISNPGKQALEATLSPPQSTYLYFVSHGDGTTEFTSNLEDHNRAVRKYQIDPSARQGKSWRDLRKNASSH